MPKIIELKTLPEFFEQVDCEVKPFELRRMDRPFDVEDVLVLREYNGSEYTGRYTVRVVTYILTAKQFPNGVMPGYGVLGIRPAQVEELERVADDVLAERWGFR